MKANSLSALKPEIQTDLFICDLADAAIKDDMASMEHPVFTLSKKPDTKIKVYTHNGNTLTVTPSVKGHATIYDKDIIIYAISKVMQAKNEGKPISKDIVFEAQECLRFICRTNKNGNPGGEDYRRLEKALERLRGTMLKTDIRTGGKLQTDIFGLIDSARIHRETMDGRVLEWGITLSDWTMNAIMNDEVLTLHPDYFRLRKPIEKRLYELARRHCGASEEWRINTQTLLKKSGAASPKKEFKRLIKGLMQHQHLPDYNVALENDLVIFTKKSDSKVGTKRKDKTPPPTGEHYTESHIQRMIDSKCEKYTRALASQKNLDFYDLKQQFADWINQTGIPPENISAAFIGFVQKKEGF